MRIISLASLTICSALLSHGIAEGAVYQWEDSQGVVHFTDNPEKIPSRYRKKVRERIDGENGQQAPAAGDASKTASPAGASDTVAPNRDFWQNRFQTLRKEKATLENNLTVKRNNLSDAQWRKRKFAKPGNRVETNVLEEEIRRDEARVKEIDKELADLDIEASKAAVPLDWRK